MDKNVNIGNALIAIGIELGGVPPEAKSSLPPPNNGTAASAKAAGKKVDPTAAAAAKGGAAAPAAPAGVSIERIKAAGLAFINRHDDDDAKVSAREQVVGVFARFGVQKADQLAAASLPAVLQAIEALDVPHSIANDGYGGGDDL